MVRRARRVISPTVIGSGSDNAGGLPVMRDSGLIVGAEAGSAVRASRERRSGASGTGNEASAREFVWLWTASTGFILHLHGLPEPVIGSSLLPLSAALSAMPVFLREKGGAGLTLSPTE